MLFFCFQIFNVCLYLNMNLIMRSLKAETKAEGLLDG